MNISKKLIINTPIEKVWETLAENYTDVDKWASAVSQSSPRMGKAVEGAPCYGRLCETSLGPFTEALVAYDKTNHSFSYIATGDKMPFFIKQLKANWKLDKLSPTKTATSMSFDCDISFPFNLLMGWMMKMQFNKAISQTIEDLQFFLETGELHPRKLASSKKAGKLVTGS